MRSSRVRKGISKQLMFFATAMLAPSLPAIASAPSCLLVEADSCTLKTDHLGFRIQVDERGSIVVVFGNTPEDLARAESYVNVQEDLGRLEQLQNLDSSTSSKMKDELSKYDGTAYQIPDSGELHSAIGFSPDANVRAEDLQDLIRVHMQLVLSVSALTSTYLADVMGLHVIEKPAPAATPAPTPTPQSPPEPAPTGTPSATPTPQPLESTIANRN